MSFMLSIHILVCFFFSSRYYYSTLGYQVYKAGLNTGTSVQLDTHAGDQGIFKVERISSQTHLARSIWYSQYYLCLPFCVI